jgi:hypothetical protein
MVSVFPNKIKEKSVDFPGIGFVLDEYGIFRSLF